MLSDRVHRFLSTATLLAVGVICWSGLAVFSTVHAQQSAPGPTINWKKGPVRAPIGNVAEIQVPEGFQFTGVSGTQMIMEMMQNPIGGNELGMLMPEAEDANWFIVFEFDDVGYITDDDRDELDADAMLKSIREGNEQANAERSKRGWGVLNIVGWQKPPAYDPVTNNLTWAIRAQAEGESIVNYNTRLLGRTGVMKANLVVDPEDLDTVLPHFKSLLSGFSFQSGKKYAEFKSGDKVAKYGLAALVTGGAAAVALKAGLFKKLWKLIVVVFVAAGAALKKIFGRASD